MARGGKNGRVEDVHLFGGGREFVGTKWVMVVDGEEWRERRRNRIALFSTLCRPNIRWVVVHRSKLRSNLTTFSSFLYLFSATIPIILADVLSLLIHTSYSQIPLSIGNTYSRENVSSPTTEAGITLMDFNLKQDLLKLDICTK